MINCDCMRCGYVVLISVPEDKGPPKFGKHSCEQCGFVMWTKLTRVNPMSWSEDGFHKEFIIDEETKRIVPRPKVDA